MSILSRTAPFLLVAYLSASASAAQPPSEQTAAADPRTGLILGQVIDAGSGRPLPDAVVELMPALPDRPPAPGGATSARPSALTDADGRFLFRGLARGNYGILSRKPGYLDGASGRRRPDGATQRLTLAAGEKVGDVTIPMWRFATIAGTVVDEAGEPIVGVQMVALRRNVTGARRRFSIGMSAFRDSTRTDDRGAFRIPNLLPGEYVVAMLSTIAAVPRSTAEGYLDAIQSGNDAAREALSPIFQIGGSTSLGGTPTALDTGGTILSLGSMPTPPPSAGKLFVYPMTYYPAAATAAQGSPIAVGSGEERGSVDFQVRPVATSRISGTVMSANGPVANLPLILSVALPQDVAADTDAIGATLTDAQGAFVFPAVPIGQYTLRAIKLPPSPRPESVSSVIQLGSGMAVATTFTSGDSRPAPIPADPTEWAAMTIAVGRNDIRNLAVVLQNGARVSGRAEFDGSTARPQADAMSAIRVVLESEVSRPTSMSMPGMTTSAWTARIDETGALNTIGVPAGRYYLRITSSPRGWTFKSATVGGRDISDAPLEIGAADITGVAVTFTDQPTELSGNVSAPSGSADPDATVLVFPTDTQAWATPPPASRRFRAIRAERNGSYRLTGLPAGSYYAIAVPDTATSDWIDPRYLDQLARMATEIRIDDGEKKVHDLKTREVR